MRARWMWLAVFLLAITAGPAGAAKADYSAIDTLLADVAMGQLSIMGARDPLEIQNRGLKAKASLESHIDAALVAAKKNPDLLRATKDFYVAATSYFGNAAPTTLADTAISKRAKATMDEKRTALELELKLVE